MGDRVVVKVIRKMNAIVAEERDGRRTVCQPTGPLLSHLDDLNMAYMYAKVCETGEVREVKPYRLAPYSEWDGNQP